MFGVVQFMSMLLLWILSPCALASRYQRFEGTSASGLKMEAVRSS